MKNAMCNFVVIFVLLMQGISLNCAERNRPHASATLSNTPSKELMQIIALNNKKGKKSVKKSDMLKRIYATTMQMAQSPVNYVFGKKSSAAKKAFYTLLGLSALLSVVYGFYNWSIIETWLKRELREKEEENNPHSLPSNQNIIVDRTETPENQPKTDSDSTSNGDHSKNVKDKKEPVTPVDPVIENELNPSRPNTAIQSQVQDLIKQDPEVVPSSQESQPKVRQPENNGMLNETPKYQLASDRHIVSIVEEKENAFVSSINDTPKQDTILPVYTKPEFLPIDARPENVEPDNIPEVVKSITDKETIHPQIDDFATKKARYFELLQTDCNYEETQEFGRLRKELQAANAL